MAPLPNCFSMAAMALATAFIFSLIVVMCVSLWLCALSSWVRSSRRYCSASARCGPRDGVAAVEVGDGARDAPHARSARAESPKRSTAASSRRCPSASSGATARSSADGEARRSQRGPRAALPRRARRRRARARRRWARRRASSASDAVAAARDVDVQVDAVEQRPGEARAVGRDARLRAGAGAQRAAEVAARAGVERRHEHEVGRVDDGAARAHER